MIEEWRAIEGTDGMIEVSNKGNVRSLLRSGTVLKAQEDSKGYYRISVTIKRTKITLKVHREVAKAFIPNPDNKPQVNHIDGDKHNNSVSNLEWVTNQENASHARRSGLWDSVIAGSIRENERRKRPVVASKDGEEKRFCSVREAERYFNSRHIVDCIKGKRSRVAGWSFAYDGR